MLKSVSGTNRY